MAEADNILVTWHGDCRSRWRQARENQLTKLTGIYLTMIKPTWTAAVVFGLAVLPLAAVNTTGHWQLKGEVAGNPIAAECDFKQDAAKLAGTCKAGEMAAWKIEGEVQDKKIAFHHDVDYGGSTYTLNYTGTFESDTTAKGDIDVSGASGEFTLTKATGAEPKKEAAAATPVLSGSWKVDANIGGETHSGTCTIQQDGEKLIGTCKVEGNDQALTGEVKGHKVTWTHKGEYNGDALTANYKGDLESPTSIKGDVDVQPFNVQGTFTATKVQ
jgi:hypothetical protein